MRHAWLWLCLEPKRLSARSRVAVGNADPADRLIAATARTEGMPLVTQDTRIRASRLVEAVW